jgi:hypothetical protein
VSGQVSRAVFPAMPLWSWEPASDLVSIWREQISAQQREDCAQVDAMSLMSEARFWAIVSAPSTLGRVRVANQIRDGWRIFVPAYMRDHEMAS